MNTHLDDYLSTLKAWGVTLPEGELGSLPSPESVSSCGPVRRLLRSLVSRDRRFALRDRLQLHLTSAIRFSERRRAADLARRSPLLLQLGSGWSPKAGWVNVDLTGHPVDLRWNLYRPLPFGLGTVDGIFHEHLLEHLPLQAGFEFLRANYRLLRPGGVLRVVVPDAGTYLESYASGGAGMMDQVRPGRPTDMLVVNELFYNYSHTAMYDEETLVLFLEAVGFRDVKRRAFGESHLQPCPDSEHRRPESLYVEAVK